MEEEERRKRARLTPPLNVSAYNKRAREEADRAVRYLILFLQRQPEEEIVKILPWRTARALAMAMLGDGCPQRSRRNHEIAQQMISRAAATLLEMLDQTHIEIVSKRLYEMQMDARAVSPPMRDTIPNLDYQRNRQQIEQDLIQANVNSTKIEPVSVNSPKFSIVENFVNCGYFQHLTEDQQKQARQDPVEWLRDHPYLYGSYPQFFVDALK